MVLHSAENELAAARMKTQHVEVTDHRLQSELFEAEQRVSQSKNEIASLQVKEHGKTPGAKRFCPTEALSPVSGDDLVNGDASSSSSFLGNGSVKNQIS